MSHTVYSTLCVVHSMLITVVHCSLYVIDLHYDSMKVVLTLDTKLRVMIIRVRSVYVLHRTENTSHVVID